MFPVTAWKGSSWNGITMMMLFACAVPRRSGAFQAAAFGNLPSATRKVTCTFLSSSTTSTATETVMPPLPKHIAIVGGGLAGLSTAFHLLEQANERGTTGPIKITILDKANVGMGGASSVAGGLIHPLSPRGKLVHWGREGLEATNYLVDQAAASADEASSPIVLRSELFRLATSAKQAEQLQQTSQNFAEFCEFKEPEELPISLEGADDVCGGLRLHNGCKALHIPSYLKGLWAACQAWQLKNSDFEIQWKLLDPLEVEDESDDIVNKYDTIVWAAGSGMFESNELSIGLPGLPSPEKQEFPVHMVRGQSVEVRLPPPTDDDISQHQALMSGKYVTPLPDAQCILIGATHEFKPEPLSHDEVEMELKERTLPFAPHVWGEGAVVERYTEGFRVQTQRAEKGRLPIVGKLEVNVDTKSNKQIGSPSHWIFTGLSSRGLLYHGVYGKVLATSILEGSERCLKSSCYTFDWWRKTKKK